MVVFFVFATIICLYGDSMADFALQDRQSLVVCSVPLHQRTTMIVWDCQQRMLRMNRGEKHDRF
ncbi:hypothetical protein Hanom_Chr09g00814191 [Helianthus anomalus]